MWAILAKDELEAQCAAGCDDCQMALTASSYAGMAVEQQCQPFDSAASTGSDPGHPLIQARTGSQWLLYKEAAASGADEAEAMARGGANVWVNALPPMLAASHGRRRAQGTTEPTGEPTTGGPTAGGTGSSATDPATATMTDPTSSPGLPTCYFYSGDAGSRVPQGHGKDGICHAKRRDMTVSGGTVRCPTGAAWCRAAQRIARIAHRAQNEEDK